MSSWLERVNTLVTASGINKQILADSLGVDYSTLYRYLKGQQDMPSTVLMKLLGQLGASLADIQSTPAANNIRFRADTAGARELPTVQKTIRRFADYAWLEDTLMGEPVRELALASKLIIKRKGNEADIATLARSTRASMGFSESGPIPSFISCLQLTVKLLTYKADDKPDGFSVMEPDWGWCMAVNVAGRPVERVLFTAAHELGHMVCGHLVDAATEGNATTEIEKVADSFAGYFLVPGESLRAHWKGVNPGNIAINQLHLHGLKSIYGVSYHCLLTRLLGDKLITGTQYGYWKARLYPENTTVEPDAQQTSPSYEERLNILVLQAYQQEQIGTQKVAELLDVSFEKAWEYLREVGMND
ncbi:MAG: ImmA/IrrE family metallo-endopeptidase [bacterium]